MNLLREQEHHLRLLLNHLESTNQQANQYWQGWQITRLGGGANKQLFRAKHLKLPKAFSASAVAEGRSLVNQQLARIPSEVWPTTLKDLVRRFEQAEIPEWGKAPVTLCRIDPNVSNFIRCVNGLTSVDWEYSGWGDPAFDIADLMTHPTYMDVPSSRWVWLIQIYGDLVDDSTMATRIEAYYRILLVWWVARSARFLYEVPRGLDNRLVSQPTNWQARIQMQYDHYSNLAESMLDIRQN